MGCAGFENSRCLVNTILGRSQRCPGGGGGKIGECQCQVRTCTHRGVSEGEVPPEKVEDFGIFILNSCNLVNTSRQNLCHY